MGFLSQRATAFNLMMLFRNSTILRAQTYQPFMRRKPKDKQPIAPKRGMIVVVDYKLRLHSRRRGGRALDSKATRRKSLLCSVLRGEAEAWRGDCFCCPGDMTLDRSFPYLSPSPHSQMDSNHAWAARVHGVKAARTSMVCLRSRLIFTKPGEVYDLPKVTKLRRREARTRI